MNETTRDAEHASPRNGGAADQLDAGRPDASASSKFKRTRLRRSLAPSPAAPESLLGSDVALQSLAPRYNEAQHGTYVRRLTEAVRNPKNLNIALTGRYGSGKSSVLDRFEELRQDSTVRFAISSLSPGEDEGGMTKTNRIQKELVKQIVYAAPKKVGRNSRFSRIAVPHRPRVLVESVAAVSTVWAALYVLGWLPSLKGLGQDTPGLARAAVWTGLGATIALALMGLRLAVHGRFRVADVKAAGASVSLTDKAPTFFDKYLDELVHYFDEDFKDIVIFEDLDRFEDPQIFQQLRELNTLLNETPRRRRKRDGGWLARAVVWVLSRFSDNLVPDLRQKWPPKRAALLLGTGEPLRFVYAVKDSLFEQIDADSKNLALASGDAAAAETLRANRTKFFDVVIPMVPFISHRNARELLDEALKDAGVTGMNKRLVGVVARHATDMRLLRNMCNEYVVFAERLLAHGQVAPDLDPNKLFALVAYKNFHLTDFELIPRRGSALDCLLDHKLDLVRTHIARLHARQRTLRSHAEQARTHTVVAARMGKGLQLYSQLRVQASQWGNSTPSFRVGKQTFAYDEAADYDFWAAVAAAEQFSILHNNGQVLDNLTRETIETLFPEAFAAGDWLRIDEAARQAELRRNDLAVETLRGADFPETAALSQYTLTLTPAQVRPGRIHSADTAKPADADDAAAKDQTPKAYTFAELVDAVLDSPLARDLVKNGFIDQNFTLYAAQFYGRFNGVDVARFVVQGVQANKMLLDHEFTSTGAVANLLDEVGEDFLSTVSGYNVDVVNHLIATGHRGIRNVASRLAANDDDARRAFLASYFTSGQAQEQLAAQLSAHPWRGVFTYLCTDPDVADDVRPTLVSAALGAADPKAEYDLDEEIRQFIEMNYLNMTAFTGDPSPEVAKTVAEMVARAGVVIPVLDAVRALRLRRILVLEHRYKLTGDNLRTALGVTNEGDELASVELDEVGAELAVYEYCLAHPAAYLDVIEGDKANQRSVNSPEALATVLKDITDANGDPAEPWTRDELHRLLVLASPDSSLPSITAAAQALWPALVTVRLVDPTFSNIEAYRAAFGIDKSLAAYLAETGRIAVGDDASDEGSRADLAVALLNTPALPPRIRVALVESLKLEEPLDAELIKPEGSDLFALLLRAGLVPDDRASFLHFREAGWPAIGPALLVSADVASFIDPPIVHGMVGDLLADQKVAERLGDTVVGRAEEFIPDDEDPGNDAALRELAKYADRHDKTLPPLMVLCIAQAGATDSSTILWLLSRTSPTATAQHIVSVFSVLGGNYTKVATVGTSFDVARDDLHDRLLAPLKEENLVRTRKVKDKIKVTVLNAL